MHPTIFTYNQTLNNFFIVGINYRKSDTNIRSKFSLSSEQSIQLLQQINAYNETSCLVLSTCNRTEIYGICTDPKELVDLLCEHTEGTKQEFLSLGYTFKGIEAIEHLFKVSSGLDSQIIGDYEILSQLKQSAKVSKEAGCLNSFMERAMNYAFQVSKEIKTKTKLSSGTVSVSYAAIEIIKQKIQHISGKSILLVGTGKFGNHVARNLQDYLPGANVSFTNRTDSKAEQLAELFNATFEPYENLAAACDAADIIIVSSLANKYTIFPAFFQSSKPRLILDLSVPQNVDPEVKNVKHITLLNVDEVSAILDETISLRMGEVPKAMNIIADTLSSLEKWHQQQFNNPLLHIVKSQLFQLNEGFFHANPSEEKLHKTISNLAVLLKHENNKGCQCIVALNSYLSNEI